MRKNYVSIAATLLLSIFIFVGCQQKEKENIETQIKNDYPSKKKTKSKEGVHKKGIEHIADYQNEIRKGIDEESSTYKEGYLLKEYNLAKQKSLAKKSSSAISPVFTERGPNNVPGRSRGIAVDPNNANRWFVGTVGGGVWLTEDAGTTWASLTDYKIPNLSTSTIVISKTNSNILYVGTGEPFGNLGAIGGSGVFKTTDGGNSWFSLAGTDSFGDVGRIIINPVDDDNVLIATSSGIYRTINGGTTWVQTYNSNGNRVQDLDVDPSNFSIQYGSVRDLGIVKSINGGLTWSVIFNKDNFNANNSRFETSVSPADPNTVFLSVYSSSDATVGVNTDFYVSRDKGASFTSLATAGSAAAANLLTGQGWYDNVIMAHPYNANVFYVGGVAVFKVTVSGSTFSSTSIASGYDNTQINNNVHVDQHGLFSILGSNQEFRILLANDGGVYSTSMKQDPGTTQGDWSNAVGGKNSTQFYGASKQNGANNYIAGAQDNGCWASLGGNSDKNKPYTAIYGGDGFEVIWHYNNPGDLIVSSQNNRIGRYVNLSYAGQTSLPGSPIFYTKVTNSDNNPDVVFSVSGNGVWRSTDFAATWNLIPISANFTPAATSSLNVKVSTADPNVVWAGAAMTESGAFVLHVSQDNGQSFSPASTYVGGNINNYISGLATSSIEKNRAYALFSSQGKAKILKTENLGASWVDITGYATNTNTGFPDVAVHSVLEMPFNKDIIWAGTDIGIFQTENGGTNWSLVSAFPSVAVYDMKVVNDQVVIASYGRGVWSATISELNSFTLPTYLAFAEVSTQQKAIESLKTVVSYKVPTDDVSRVKIFIDGTEQTEIVQDFTAGVTYTYETSDVTEGTHQLGVQVFDDTNNVQTPIDNREFLVIDFNTPTSAIGITEFQTSDIFIYKSDFKIDNLGGNASTMVLNNSDHPYNNSTTYSVALKKPLTISESNKTFTYEDVAIVEPYTDNLADLNSFYDFVIVEASTDLATWKTLDKYDARRFNEWLTEYNKGASATGSDALFKEQNIVLTDKGFNIGDTVVFRFSLVADSGANSYGWAIKSVNAGATASISEVLKGNKVFTIYPTISNGNFTIFGKNDLGKTKMNIFDLSGKQAYKSELNFSSSDKQAVTVNLNSGVYIVNLVDENGRKSSQKIVIE